MRMRKHLRERLLAAFLAAKSGFPGAGILRAIIGRILFVRSVYGVYLLDTPGDRTFELCVTGYGRFISDAIASRTDDFIFLDIGANLGLFSLLAAANPHCRKVVAFEPLQDIFRNFQANIARNGAAVISAVEGAVTSAPGLLVHLAYSPEHSGMAKIVDRRSGTVAARAISVRELDDLIPRSATPILVKIDVEGSEVDVMTALRKTASFPLVDEIIIEISEANLGPDRHDRLLGILAEAGFAELSRAGPPNHYDARYRRDGAACQSR